MPDLSARFAALFITFAPLFVQRSWLGAQGLLVSVILAPARRTVASVLRITGHARPALHQLPPRSECPSDKGMRG